MKIGVIGAGISGLSISKLLKKIGDVEILEKSSFYGGIARTKDINGITYHPVGGHCFNSKHQDVLDFVFNEVLQKDNWHPVRRDAVIKLQNKEISYPIEYSIKQIYKFNPELALKITRDFLSSEDDFKYSNLEDWFRKKFGDTLAEEYFIPYNTKIWNRHPSKMSPSWVEGKLPIPDKISFFKGLIDQEEDKMPHSSFFYPNTNSQNTFIDALAKDTDIIFNYKVEKIEKVGGKWLINSEREYDLLISTMPLNVIPTLITNTPLDVLNAAAMLKFNKVTTMLWETLPNKRTWTYVPDSDNFFHRYIHIGTFFKPTRNYSITEVIGEKTYDEMIENAKRDSFLLKPLAYNVSEHAYVVFDENYQYATTKIKSYLSELNLHTLGRFGEWEYYNMDVCIKSSLNLFQKIKEDIKIE
jgi:protoporphyrinogen oxidase